MYALAIFACLDISLAANLKQWFFLPDSPLSVTWLNDREKAIAVQRVAKTQLGIKNSMLFVSLVSFDSI